MLNALMQSGLLPYSGGSFGGLLRALKTVMGAELQRREQSMELLLSLIQGIGPDKLLAIISSEPFKKWIRKTYPEVAAILEAIPALAELGSLTEPPKEETSSTEAGAAVTVPVVPPEEDIITPTTGTTSYPLVSMPEPSRSAVPFVPELPPLPLPTPAIAPPPSIHLPPFGLPDVVGMKFPRLDYLPYLLYSGAGR
jgi:hypothetical protein